MRSLEQIFDDDGDGTAREILFEDGDWCFYRRLYRSNTEYNVIHRCDKTNSAVFSGSDASNMEPKWLCGNGAPSGCGSIAPEALQGLVALYRWRR